MALFTFTEGDIHERMKAMRELMDRDYQTIKQIVNEFNEQIRRIGVRCWFRSNG